MIPKFAPFKDDIDVVARVKGLCRLVDSESSKDYLNESFMN